MKTFLQFLNEADHDSPPGMVHDWGVIHPQTGHLVSGMNHPTAKTHAQLKTSTTKNYPEYSHYKHETHGNTVQVRSYDKSQHHSLRNSLDNLPSVKRYEHHGIDRSGNAIFKTFKSKKSLHTHLSNLVR